MCEYIFFEFYEKYNDFCKVEYDMSINDHVFFSRFYMHWPLPSTDYSFCCFVGDISGQIVYKKLKES